MFEELKQSEIASEILKQDGSARTYDVAVGVVYIEGLDDWVMSSQLAICMFGCRPIDQARPSSGAGSWAEHLLWSNGTAWSIDLGIAVDKLDKSDPRHNGKQGYLAGVSWNPMNFVRVSGGAYVFENNETDNWNTRGYVGISINVLQAAAVLGIVGLSPPPPPEIKKQ